MDCRTVNRVSVCHLVRPIVALLLLAFGTAAQAQYPWGYAPYPPAYGPRYDNSREFLARSMLDAHNAVRARVGVPPLVWSPALSAVAQDWANNLLATHRFAHSASHRYGENLYTISGGSASSAQVVNLWADEARGYDIRTDRCFGVCGHYTQIVWRTTRAVGCAVASDAYRQVWVCEYDPPGNIIGSRPY